MSSIPSHNPAVVLLGLIAAFGAVIGVFAALFLCGLLISMWIAWWLLPVWMMVMVPLGLPAITFWQLVALRVAMNVLWGRHTFRPEIKDEYLKKGTEIVWGWLLDWGLGPVLASYLVRWLMS
jgi:hypothetical protein